MLFIINCSSNDDSQTVTPSAQIISTGSILKYGDVDVLCYSVSQSLQVKGTNLTGNISLSTSANFQLSLDDASFSNAVTINAASGNAGNTIIYVRFSPAQDAIGNTTGNLTL
ncbi:hypothetical protein [Lacinutrix jangbogonensis]|uniref:hypothetical protein n=1 Tax=Lacinutrix jangbogonensis TaxID=1469557 RepID=UPI00053D3732|nr:hypothetical protein [Lacinutrix jangbogonensis]